MTDNTASSHPIPTEKIRHQRRYTPTGTDEALEAAIKGFEDATNDLLHLAVARDEDRIVAALAEGEQWASDVLRAVDVLHKRRDDMRAELAKRNGTYPLHSPEEFA